MALKSKGEAAEAAPVVDGEDLTDAKTAEEKPKAKAPEKAEAKEARETAAVKHPEKFVLKHSLPVNGGVGVYVDGQELSVQAQKGVIEFVPESFAHGLKIREVLVAAGWVDETVYPVNRPIDAPKPVVKVPKRWHFHHPDTHPTDGQPINCNLGLYVNDEEVSVEIKDSKCVVEDSQIAAALEKAGYVVDHVEF